MVADQISLLRHAPCHPPHLQHHLLRLRRLHVQRSLRSGAECNRHQGELQLQRQQERHGCFDPSGEDRLRPNRLGVARHLHNSLPIERIHEALAPWTSEIPLVKINPVNSCAQWQGGVI